MMFPYKSFEESGTIFGSKLSLSLTSINASLLIFSGSCFFAVGFSTGGGGAVTAGLDYFLSALSFLISFSIKITFTGADICCEIKTLNFLFIFFCMRKSLPP